MALGAKLFHHLLSLPIAYFEARQTGQTVARVHELETIRSFLTGSALTVVLDLAFLFVFLAVMALYSPFLTLIVIASIPAYAALSAFVTPAFRRRIEERFNRGAQNQTFLVEVHRRHRNAEGDGRRSADAAALGRPARGLRDGELSHGQPVQFRLQCRASDLQDR